MAEISNISIFLTIAKQEGDLSLEEADNFKNKIVEFINAHASLMKYDVEFSEANTEIEED